MNIFNEKEGENKEYIVLTADRTLMTEYNGFVDLLIFNFKLKIKMFSKS